MTREGELEFDFSTAVRCEKLDEKGRQLPHGMPLVDFVVEDEQCFWLVEVKDPSSNPKGADTERVNANETATSKVL